MVKPNKEPLKKAKEIRNKIYKLYCGSNNCQDGINKELEIYVQALAEAEEKGRQEAIGMTTNGKFIKRQRNETY